MSKNNIDKILQVHLIKELTRLNQKNILDKEKYKGDPGVSITKTYLKGRNLIIENSEGQVADLGPVVGQDGAPGQPGKDGTNGISITGFKTRDRELIISTSDGKKHNLGEIIPKDGFTPIKGIDYFTEDEIQSFVTRVIAELPEGDPAQLARDIESLEGMARLSFKALKDVPEFLQELPEQISEDRVRQIAGQVVHFAAGRSTSYKVNNAKAGRGKTLNIVGTGITSSSSGDEVTIDLSSLAGGGSGDSIVDADNDTKVEVEQSSDEDTIRGTVAGTERLTIDSTDYTITGDSGTAVFNLDDSGEALDLTRNNNDFTKVRVLNDTTGTSAGVGVEFHSDLGTTMGMYAHSSTRTIIRAGITLGGWNEIQVLDGSSGLLIDTVGDDPIVIGVNNSEIARFTSTGVGIGVDPENLLHIQGAGSATTQTGSTALLKLESTTNSYYPEIYFTALDSSGGSRSGAIGMDGGTGNDNVIYIANGGIQAINVDRFGHMGILTTTPNSALDVEGNITISDDSLSDYEFSLTSEGLNAQALTAGNATFNLYSLDGDSTDFVSYVVYGLGTPGSVTNRERAVFQYNSISDIFRIRTENGGTGSVLPLVLQTGSNDNQIYLTTDGDVCVGTDTADAKLTVVDDQNAATRITLTNNTDGASAYTAFRAGNDAGDRMRMGITATSGDFSGDSYDGGVGFIETDTSAMNLVNTNATGDFNFFVGGNTNSDILLHLNGTNDRVGINNTDPETILHVQKGSAGTDPTWNTSIDTAIFEGDSANNVTIQIFSAANKVGNIGFSDPDGRNRGVVAYSHSDDAMLFNVEGSEKVRITSTGLGVGENDPDTLIHYTSGALRGENGTIEICQLDGSDVDKITTSAVGLPNFISYSGAVDTKVGLWVANSWTSGTATNTQATYGLNAFSYLEGSTDADIAPATIFNAAGGRYGTRLVDTAQAHTIVGVTAYNNHQGSGTTTNSWHFLSEGMTVNTGSGITITNLHHFRVASIPSQTGTVTNQYGLYIPTLSNASNNYGAYIADNVGIGVEVPDTQLHVGGAITFAELSSDPSDPDEGNTVIWQSDGTGTGDDGDIYIKTTAGATTKTIQITDFSAGALVGGGAESDTLQTVFDRGQAITIADTDNQTLAITNNDTTNDPDTISITNAGAGRSIYIDANGDTGNGASSSGAFFLDSTGNPGIGMNLYSNGTTSSVSLLFMKYDNTSMDGKILRIDHDGLGGSLIELNANNASHNDPILRINGSGTGGGQADIRIDSPNPDIELIDTDYTTPDGKYEIDVGPYTGSKSAIRINSRNDADNSFEPIAYFFRKGSTGGGMAIEDGVITMGGYDVTADDGYGKIIINSNAVSPSSIDLSNSFTVGTGTGGANATSKHLGNFAWMSRDASFTAPKIVAHISVEATETYAADTDVGSRMVFYTGTDNNTNPDAKMAIEQDGQILLNSYGSGTFSGTVAEYLAVDSSGNVIETSAPTAEAFTLFGRYNTTVSSAGTSLYFPLWGNHGTTNSSYQTSYNIPVPVACTLYGIGFSTTANTFDDAFDIWPIVNGSRAASGLTVGTGNTTDYTGGLSISLSAGDLLQFEIDRTGPTSGSASNATVIFYFN